MKYSISKDEVLVLLEFLSESNDHLDGIEEKVLKLEVSKDVELINSIFRPIHTIKGTSSFLNLTSIGKLSHEVETLLDDIRKGRISEINEKIIDVILDSIDALSRMLNNTADVISAQNHDEDIADVEIEDVEYSKLIERVLEVRGKPAAAGSQDGDAEGAPVVADEVEELPLIEEDKPEKMSVEFPQEMKAQYEQEGFEHLGRIEDILLELESSPESTELYNDLFRALHSLKGNTGVILSIIDDDSVRQSHFLNNFRELSHLAESLVQKKRDNNIPLIGDEVDILFRVKDFLLRFLEDFRNNIDSHINVTEILMELKGESEPDAEGIKKIGGDSLAAAISTNIKQATDAVRVGLEQIGDDGKREKALKKVRRGYRTLKKVGEKVKHKFLVEKSNASLGIVDFLLMGKDDNEELFIADLKKDLVEIVEKADRRKTERVDRRKATTPPAPTSSASAPAPSAAVSKTPAGGQSDKIIKVAQEKIDTFMNLIGELLVSKNNLNMISRNLEAEDHIAKRLKESVEAITRISEQLQNNIMEIRMLPIANAFSKFPRMIRDLSKKLNKKIKLEISGEETEIDKNIIEALSDPLVHMIRNSADHGIETPEERVEMGKPDEGTVQLKAFNQGQYVIIQIIDDGKGIDVRKIKAKVIEKGLVAEADLDKMDDTTIINMIFMPGFSMAKEVTDVSGRGVGMDVVKTNIEKLGGDVSIESTLGKGSVFTIRLPLTMAIGRGLEVSAGNNRYFLPLEYIVETLRVDSVDINQYKGKEMVVVRDELIPVRRLESLLGMKNNTELERVATVILNVKGMKVGLVVSDYYNESEYVIKPLTGSISDVDGISGAMITGDGRINLILDIPRLF